MNSAAVMPRVSEPAKDVVIRVPRLLPLPQPEASGNDSNPSGAEPAGKKRKGAVESDEEEDDSPKFRPDLSKLPADPKQAAAIKAVASAAEWNSLLLWARSHRGPQWDAGTSM